MDPISVIGLAGSLVGISDVIAKSLRRLINLQSRYRSASLVVSLLIGQLSTLKSALNQITDFVTSSLTSVPRREQLVADFGVSLESCKLLITVLEERINQLEYDDNGSLNAKGKVVFLWEESELNAFTAHLNNQANALNLLLTALHCRTTFERNALLQDDESRRIIKRVEDNRASLLSLGDSSSSYTRRSRRTENSNLLDTEFGFDNEVIATDVYRAALRSNLQKAASKRGDLVLPGTIEGDRSTPMPTARLDNLGSGSGPLLTTSLYDGLMLESPQEFSALRRWFQSDSAITRTTEFDRFSSRLSRVGSLLRRGDNASVFSFKSQAKSEDEKPDYLLIATSKPLPKPKTARRHLRTKKAPEELKIEKCDVAEEELKVILLGSGNSGKSTLFKSIDALHQGGLNLEERLRYKEAVFTNTIQSMRNIIQAMGEKLDLPLNDSTNHRHVQTILFPSSSFVDHFFFSDVCPAIEALWKDEGVQQAFERSNEYLLQDSAAYFFNSVRRISETDYIPTDEDIRRARIRSTGIFSTMVKSSGITFRLIDTGGERSERKKWISQFEHISIAVIVVDISAYDLVLYEEDSVNRMQEDFTLFESLCNSRWFVKSHIILLFTKVDILEQKITKVPFRRYFPDFTGKENNLHDVKDYIEVRFESLNNHPTKPVQTIFASFVDEYDGLANLVLEAIVSRLSPGLDTSLK